VREDKAPTKSAPVKSGGGGGGGGGGGNRTSTLGDQPAADGCRCYVGNLAWETTEESLIGACTRNPVFFFFSSRFCRARLVSPRSIAHARRKRRRFVHKREKKIPFVHFLLISPLLLFSSSLLAAHCAVIGTVVQSEVARQPGGRSKGWGLVDYENSANAELVHTPFPLFCFSSTPRNV
jgi:hypothetical protein